MDIRYSPHLGTFPDQKYRDGASPIHHKLAEVVKTLWPLPFSFHQLVQFLGQYFSMWKAAELASDMLEHQVSMEDKNKQADNCSRYIQTERLILAVGEGRERSAHVAERVEHMFDAIGSVMHRVVNSVMDLTQFWVVVGLVDASQSRALMKNGSPPKELTYEENSSTLRSDQMAAADGMMKEYVVEMNREGLWEWSLGKIVRPGS